MGLEQELKKVLHPHQVVRLGQAALQKAIQLNGDPAMAFQSGVLSSKLKNIRLAEESIAGNQSKIDGRHGCTNDQA